MQNLSCIHACQKQMFKPLIKLLLTCPLVSPLQLYKMTKHTDKDAGTESNSRFKFLVNAAQTDFVKVEFCAFNN